MLNFNYSLYPALKERLYTQRATIEVTALVSISIVVKRHYDHSNSYKEKYLIEVAYSSEVQSIIIMAGHGNVQVDMALEK